MDAGKALEMLKSLADGVDPVTGWVLPAGHPCQHPELIRALFTSIGIVERQVKRDQRLESARLTLPANTGKSWSVAEEAMLLKRFSAGTPVPELAQLHRRTTGSIRARLERLGQLPAGEPAGIPKRAILAS